MTPESEQAQSSQNRVALVFMLLAVIAVVWLFSSLYKESKPPAPHTSDDQRELTPLLMAPLLLSKPEFSEPPLPLPATGASWSYFTGEAAEPFEFVTRSGTVNYWIKIVNTYSDQMVMTFFIRNGERTEVKVPLGTYEVRYATGQTWYGRTHLFGPTTSYHRADDTFHFDGRHSWQIQLYAQINGNLRTEEIKPEEF